MAQAFHTGPRLDRHSAYVADIRLGDDGEDMGVLHVYITPQPFEGIGGPRDLPQRPFQLCGVCYVIPRRGR